MEFVEGTGDLGCPGAQLLLEVVGEVDPERRVGLVVPLAHPWLEFVQACDEWDEAFVVPAFRLAVLDKGRERERLLGVVPAGPPEHWSRVSLPAGVGVEDEALLGHVELPPVLLTIAACSGCASGTLMTSMRKSAELGFLSGLSRTQPGSSASGRTPAEPET